MPNPILVVEDNEDLSILFSLVLESAGYQVKTAENARKALEFLSQNKPQLILMDVMMPGTNGLQLTRAIKEQSDYQSLPVILVSAIDRLKDEQLQHSKADDIIYKPFDLDDLLSRVADLVSSPTRTLGSSIGGSI